MVLPFAVTTTKAAATARRPTEKAARPFTLLLLQLQPLRPATILHSTILLSLFKFGTTLAPTTLPSHSSSQITRSVARLQGEEGRHRPLGTRSLIPASVLDLQSCGDLNAHTTQTLLPQKGCLNLAYPFSTLTIQTVFDKIG